MKHLSIVSVVALAIFLTSCNEDVIDVQTYPIDPCDTMDLPDPLTSSIWHLDSIGHAEIWKPEHSNIYTAANYDYVRSNPTFEANQHYQKLLYLETPFVYPDSSQVAYSWLNLMTTGFFSPRNAKKRYRTTADSLVIFEDYVNDGGEPDGFEYKITPWKLILSRTYIDVHWVGSGIEDHRYLHYYEFHFSRVDTLCH